MDWAAHQQGCSSEKSLIVPLHWLLRPMATAGHLVNPISSILKVGRATGKLRHFVIEPFVPHADVSILTLLDLIVITSIKKKGKLCM